MVSYSVGDFLEQDVDRKALTMNFIRRSRKLEKHAGELGKRHFFFDGRRVAGLWERARELSPQQLNCTDDRVISMFPQDWTSIGGEDVEELVVLMHEMLSNRVHPRSADQGAIAEALYGNDPQDDPQGDSQDNSQDEVPEDFEYLDAEPGEPIYNAESAFDFADTEEVAELPASDSLRSDIVSLIDDHDIQLVFLKAATEGKLTVLSGQTLLDYTLKRLQGSQVDFSEHKLQSIMKKSVSMLKSSSAVLNRDNAWKPNFQVIYYCVNGCMAFTGEHENKDSCVRCDTKRSNLYYYYYFSISKDKGYI